MRPVGQLDFQLLLAVGRPRPQTLQFFLRLGVILLDLRRDVHLLLQALIGFRDAQTGDVLQFLPFLPVLTTASFSAVCRQWVDSSSS